MIISDIIEYLPPRGKISLSLALRKNYIREYDKCFLSKHVTEICSTDSPKNYFLSPDSPIPSTVRLLNTFLFDGSLPIIHDKIKVLIFADCFDQVITPNILPNSIVVLILGKFFNQPLTVNGKPIIPRSVRHLNLGHSFNHPFDITGIPFVKLGFGKKFSQAVNKSVFPQSLTHLCFAYYKSEVEIPETVTHLEVHLNLINFTVPASVIDLVIGAPSASRKDVVPKSVTRLEIYSAIEKPVSYYIPHHITHLILAGHFNKPLEHNGKSIIPDSVIYLELPYYFNHPVIKSDGTSLIPESVVHLYLGHYFNYPIATKSLRTLRIGCRYTYDCPESIKKIIVPSCKRHISVHVYLCRECKKNEKIID